MSSTAPATTTPRDEPLLRRRHGGRGRFHRGWRQALVDTAYILTGFVLSMAWWILLVALISTGAGMVVTLIGIPILAATVFAWTVIADSERWRARVFLGLEVPRPYRSIVGGADAPPGFLRRVFEPHIVWQRVKDPAVWRDLVYLLVVFFPLAIVTFAVAIAVWGTALMLAAQPFVFWKDAGLTFDLDKTYRIDTVPEAAACFVAGLAILAILPWLLGLLVAAHAWTVRSLLGRSSSERVEELTRQRTEAVDAAVAERRRIERDLHDGAQQRLTALAIDLGRARAKLDTDPDGAKDLVDQAHEDAKQALAELRNLARGIHPAILTDRGLDAALSALAARSTIPVEISVEIATRPSAAVESTAYFVVAEALANASKHAAATRLRVRVCEDGETMTVEVEDDGVGGAHLEPGGGLEGLTTRVATVGGAMGVASPDGGPTIIRAELPCAS